MKVKELKEILSRVSDDFNLVIRTVEEVPLLELQKMSYPYPYNYENFTNISLGDIGHSDKVIVLDVTI